MPDAITGDRPELKPVNIGAAAIDIGSKMHVAAVNPTCTDVPVRAFGHSRRTCMIWRTGSKRAA